MLPIASMRTSIPLERIHSPTSACTWRIGGERKVLVIPPSVSEHAAICRQRAMTRLPFSVRKLRSELKPSASPALRYDRRVRLSEQRSHSGSTHQNERDQRANSAYSA